MLDHGVEHGVGRDEIEPAFRIEYLVGRHAAIAADGHVDPEDGLGAVPGKAGRDDAEGRPHQCHGQHEPLVPEGGRQISLPIALFDGRWRRRSCQAFETKGVERGLAVSPPGGTEYGNARFFRLRT